MDSRSELPDLYRHVDLIAVEDATGLARAWQSYGDSWKSRGGVSAFMMLARKWDRLENRVKEPITERIPNEQWCEGPQNGLSDIECVDNITVYPYDIFGHCEADERSEGLIDDVRDLRRYLLLVEAELRSRNIVHGKHRDNEEPK